MYVLWVVWAFSIGAVSTVALKDWWKNSITQKELVLLSACIALGIGVPIAASIVWSPVQDPEHRITELFLGAGVCVLAYAAGLGITMLLRWFVVWIRAMGDIVS